MHFLSCAAQVAELRGLAGNQVFPSSQDRDFWNPVQLPHHGKLFLCSLGLICCENLLPQSPGAISHDNGSSQPRRLSEWLIVPRAGAYGLLPCCRPTHGLLREEQLWKGFSGAPEGQPSVISTRKSTRLCVAGGGSGSAGPALRSIAQEQRCRNALGVEGSSRTAGQGSGRAQLCVCTKWKCCDLFIPGRTLLLYPPERPLGAGLAAREPEAPPRVEDLLGLLH